jgi:hypothetical protein
MYEDGWYHFITMTEHNINLRRLRIAMKRVYQESLFDIQNGEREENKFI